MLAVSFRQKFKVFGLFLLQRLVRDLAEKAKATAFNFIIKNLKDQFW